MKNINLNEVIKSIKPEASETKEAKYLINSIINKIKINNTKTSIGGSWAKNTHLTGNHDIDIYVKFNLKKYQQKDISKILEKELKKHFKIEKLHGSRDYFQIKKEHYTVEIIPILEISKVSEAKNITDISPLHVKFVNKNKKYCDNIRLAKRFAKISKVYGAESYIKGFSGYVLEILTIHYKSFNNLIKAISRWKDTTEIGNKTLIKELNKAKKESPLILIDPTDPSRNAAAALSKEKYDLFIKACNSYLKNPSEKFFKEQIFDINDIRRKNKTNKIIILNIIPLKKKTDVAGAKMLKAFQHIIKKLEENDFRIKHEGWVWNKDATFYFIFDKKSLSKTKKHYGPKIKMEKACEEFRESWNKNKILKEKGNLYVIIKRKYRIPEELIKNLIKDKYIKELVKEIKLV
ncbi:MAG: CCA tRNA nucleotidyltransferase [Candidatus Nanoarchaeia archaeon]|nr:CCA tRNA nucleotidyltransferase [Candidatus Nanoarchaeia archaeon]